MSITIPFSYSGADIANKIFLIKKNDSMRTEHHSWLRGPVIEDGFFTLKNQATGKLLTSIRLNGLVIKSNISFLKLM